MNEPRLFKIDYETLDMLRRNGMTDEEIRHLLNSAAATAFVGSTGSVWITGLTIGE